MKEINLKCSSSKSNHVPYWWKMCYDFSKQLQWKICDLMG